MAVEEIGKRVLSKFRTGNGNGPTVMRICGDILAQRTRGKVAGARCFRTTYREEKGMVAIGKKGRRFSGHVEAPKKKKKGEEEEEEFKSPLGIVTAHFATSTFAELAPVTASLGTTGAFRL